MCEVIVLFNGYSEYLDDTRMKANCSCTLIKGERLIIVDTMTAWDRDKLIQALKREGISPSDIHYVVCTHSHADHIGNNNLFTNAEHIVGLSIQYGDIFYEKNLTNVDYQLCEGVKIVATPGHTAEDVTVLVESKIDDKLTCFAIAGDLFEKEEDISNSLIWKKLGAEELQKTQHQMRCKIINIADYVVPGHGPMFAVTNDMRQLLKNDVII